MTLEAHDIQAGYGGDPVLGRAAPINFGADAGSFTAIVGPNGSGKSTMLRVLAGLHKPSAGAVHFEGKSLRSYPRRKLARALAVLPQNPPTPPTTTVRELITLGRYAHGDHASRGGRVAIDDALDLCDLTAMADRPLDHISGGERQRAWVAMCIAQQPRVLMLDEPTAALDVRHALEIADLCARLHAMREMTVLIVLHDLNLAARVASRVVVMRQGAIDADGTPEDVFTPAVLSRAFGVHATVEACPCTGRPRCWMNLPTDMPVATEPRPIVHVSINRATADQRTASSSR